jgi:exocyst complex protein 7
MRKPVSSIYMLNNLSYMRNNLILSNQSAANDIMGSTAEDILNSAYRDAKARYLDAWRELVGLLAEPTSSGRFGVVGVGGDKQAVKDSLANFFNRLDELEVLSRQHTLSRQDPNLRERLHADVRNLVVPAFQSYMAKKHAEKCESFRLCEAIEVSLNKILHIAQIRNRHRPTSRIALLR